MYRVWDYRADKVSCLRLETEDRAKAEQALKNLSKDQGYAWMTAFDEDGVRFAGNALDGKLLKADIRQDVHRLCTRR